MPWRVRANANSRSSDCTNSTRSSVAEAPQRASVQTAIAQRAPAERRPRRCRTEVPRRGGVVAPPEGDLRRSAEVARTPQSLRQVVSHETVAQLLQPCLRFVEAAQI